MADQSDSRRKNRNWIVASAGERPASVEHCMMAVLMDIRDELQAINSKLGCYRIPRALDALHSMGVAARRRKRKTRKASK